MVVNSGSLLVVNSDGEFIVMVVMVMVQNVVRVVRLFTGDGGE